MEAFGREGASIIADIVYRMLRQKVLQQLWMNERKDVGQKAGAKAFWGTLVW